jgi:hypothetical protein
MAEERERFRDLEERLLRTEQFAEQSMAAEAQAKEKLAALQKGLEVGGGGIYGSGFRVVKRRPASSWPRCRRVWRE